MTQDTLLVPGSRLRLDQAGVVLALFGGCFLTADAHPGPSPSTPTG